MYVNLNDRQVRSCPSGTQCSSTLTSSSTLASSPSSSTSAPQNVGTAASTTSVSPSQMTTVVVDTPGPAPKGPIIAGVICGIAVVVILTAMLWFFCRRRRQLDLMGRSTPLVGNDGSNGTEKFAMDHSIDEEAQRHSDGVFAPFGGYNETSSVEARDNSGRSLTRSLDISAVQPIIRPTADPSNADADAPIPDPEKSSLVAPPAHEHPAYHQLPGQAPEVPVYNQSQQSAHPASRSSSTRDPAYNSLPSQSTRRSKSFAQAGPAYDSLPSQSPPEPAYDPKRPSGAAFRAELQSPDFSPLKLDVPEESPELPALTFSPISLDASNHTTPGTTYQFPSPSEMAPIPRFTSPTDIAPSVTARFPSPSQLGQSIEQFRPTPLTATEIAEIGTSMSPFRPSPLSSSDIAELSNSPKALRSNSLSKSGSPEYQYRSSPQPSTTQSKATEYPFQSPPPKTSYNDQPAFTPMRTPSLSRARELIRRHSSFKNNKRPELPSPQPVPDLPTLPSPTPPPLKFKKRSATRSELPAVSTTYIPPRKPTPAKDLPFNYISLPSPQSPTSPSAIQPPTSAMDAIARNGSATTTYSIPIGLTRSHKRKDTANSAKTIIVEAKGVRLTHNHSREWSESDREHVMSWATYNGPDSPLMEGGEEFSPMVEQVAKLQKVERFQNPKLLRRKSPVQELRQGVGQQETENGEFKKSSRMSLKQRKSSSKQEKKRDSPKIAKMSSPESSVSPLFSPIPAGYKFSPLSPEERVWAGQE